MKKNVKLAVVILVIAAGARILREVKMKTKIQQIKQKYNFEESLDIPPPFIPTQTSSEFEFEIIKNITENMLFPNSTLYQMDVKDEPFFYVFEYAHWYVTDTNIYNLFSEIESIYEIGITTSGDSKIDHPHHYGGKDNPYETIKIIENLGFGFHIGNVFKYIARAGKKDPQTKIEDLKKAQWYLERYIEEYENIKSKKLKTE